MSISVNELLQTLDAAKSIEEVDLIVEEIAKIGETAIDDILKYSKSLYRKPGRYLTIVKIFNKMGYPTNKKAIPYLVTHASMINSSGWDLALKTVMEIGDPALPEIKEALQFYSKDVNEYALEIQGLTILLKMIGAPSINMLIPELLYILDLGDDQNYVDLYVLDPLRKIGSPIADGAISGIGKIIESDRNNLVKKAAMEALVDFNSNAVAPLLPIIKKYIQNDDLSLRTSAESLLKKLNQ